MNINKIKPYEKNAKKHSQKQIEQIANSIKEFGFNQPIVIDKNGVIIVGHGRYEASKLLGLKDVPVIEVDLTEEQAKAYRLADNKLNESDWDMALVIEELKENNIVNKDIKIYCNMAGDWDLGGFDADTGLTGRKIAVDNYGPRIPIGGGCFSGKDATKVDRSGAYKARQIAVKELRKHNAKEVLVKIAYSIGVAEPVMITEQIDGKEIDITKEYKNECKPKNIIKDLKLREPIFQDTATKGHFGNGFEWDK